jgi:hypothetical protein
LHTGQHHSCIVIVISAEHIKVSNSIIARIISHHHRYLKLAQGRRRCFVSVAGKLVRAALAPQENAAALRSPHHRS